MLRSRWLAVPVVLLPVAAAFGATGPFDGRYVGHGGLTRGALPTCGPPRNAVWTVTDGHVSHKYGVAFITANVGPDGSFTADVKYMHGKRADFARMEGRISGGVLEATIEGYACTYRYSLMRK
jgi:hypothetical protein